MGNEKEENHIIYNLRGYFSESRRVSVPLGIRG
jgi:hypothetical protein